jgi:hypothetical protein
MDPPLMNSSPSVSFAGFEHEFKTRNIPQSQLPVLPGENSNLPFEIFPYNSQYMGAFTNQLQRWYRFTSVPESMVPTSCWLVRKTGRADDWRLLECNESFLELLQSPVDRVSGIAFLDLVPPKFKSTTCELLQHIIRVCKIYSKSFCAQCTLFIKSFTFL